MQGGIGFLTRSYLYSCILLPVCALTKMNKYLFFVQKKDNKYGKMVRETDCIHLRGWIIGGWQNHSPGISTGLVCILSIIIILVHVLVTHLCYRDLVLHFLWPNWGDCWLWGSAFLLRVFLLWGSGHLGQVIITPLLFFSHFFLTWTTSPCFSNLFNVSWVGTDNEGQLKAVVRSQKH